MPLDTLREHVAATLAKYLTELGLAGVPDGYVWTEQELRSLDVDGVADCLELADLILAAIPRAGSDDAA